MVGITRSKVYIYSMFPALAEVHCAQTQTYCLHWPFLLTWLMSVAVLVDGWPSASPPVNFKIWHLVNNFLSLATCSTKPVFCVLLFLFPSRAAVGTFVRR